MLIGYLCLNRYINYFTLNWNQLAFAVPETVINMTVGRCFCYHEIDHLASPSYVPGTINAFNQHYCINFSQHVAHMRIFILLVTVIKKSCISVNRLKIIAYCNCKALLPVKQYKNVRNFSNFFTPKPEQKRSKNVRNSLRQSLNKILLYLQLCLAWTPSEAIKAML